MADASIDTIGCDARCERALGYFVSPLALSITLFFIAVGLTLLDIFVPSGGVLLFLSVTAGFASVLFGYRSGTTEGMVMLGVVVGSIPFLAFLAIKIWPHTPIGKRIILPTPTDSEEKSVESKPHDPFVDLVGKVGVAQNSLLPTGHVRIQHRNYNATSVTEVIEAGQLVEVIGVRERNLLVRLTLRTLHADADIQDQFSLTHQNPGNLLDMPADQLGLDSIQE